MKENKALTNKLNKRYVTIENIANCKTNSKELNELDNSVNHNDINCATIDKQSGKPIMESVFDFFLYPKRKKSLPLPAEDMHCEIESFKTLKNLKAINI